MKKGFDEFGEPTLTKLDDYRGEESQEKKEVVRWVIVSGIIIGVLFALARWYFWDKGEPDLNKNDKIIIRHY